MTAHRLTVCFALLATASVGCQGVGGHARRTAHDPHAVHPHAVPPGSSYAVPPTPPATDFRPMDITPVPTPYRAPRPSFAPPAPAPAPNPPALGVSHERSGRPAPRLLPGLTSVLRAFGPNRAVSYETESARPLVELGHPEFE